MTSSPAPALEPRTEAGRRLLALPTHLIEALPTTFRRSILAIEAEAAAESGRLREVEKAARVWADAIEQRGAPMGELYLNLRDALDAATPPAPSDHGALDVERLAKALEVVDDDQLLPSLHADSVAAEYARLAAPSVPPKDA